MSSTDDHGERLFTWAVLAPVLTRHYSIVAPSDQEVSVCACSPGIRRSIDEWARHVSDAVAASIA
ncbi:hypothetical protein [Mycolicibacterium fluoranthenivorans]|uniref:Uncharacterized protein n=1 Tax=Mycolicibacterium fluoranthenivorans TaxID=258505 RepID=A0A7X5U191_9MYCO|nr:hypothetical protein [Mycolicibacterium fluoranthenivorans]MCV7354891.1 hypothetical protein [Mycolicibacterium fluoranthenivorans]NIH96519.1 hypothetical protein [Mycolicibacterium fluoranthenivorans]